LLSDTVVETPTPPAKFNVSPPATVSVVPESAETSNEVAIAAVLAAVKRPCASTVITGTAVVLPYDPADTPVSSNLAAVTWSSPMCAVSIAPSAICSLSIHRQQF